MKNILMWGVLFSIIVALFSFLASEWPDGLEKVADDKGFIERGETILFHAPIPDYLLPGISNESLATVSAGIIGVLILFAVTYCVAKILMK